MDLTHTIPYYYCFVNAIIILQEEMDRMDGLKLAVLLNLALCCTVLGEYSTAVAYCDKALQYDVDSARAMFRWVGACKR